jgi:hypothetical protein
MGSCFHRQDPCYLERFVFPLLNHSEPLDVAAALFPDHASPAKRRTLDSYMYTYFTQPHAKPIPNFDADTVGKRISNFLQSLSGAEYRALDYELIKGLCHAMAFMFSEVVELSGNGAIDSYRSGIVPTDVRITIIMDKELFVKLQYSRVYWKGRD